jgi:signal recognition particle GTPase
MESIHNCIKGGTDLNGWKKVDWRGSSTTATRGNSTNQGGEGKHSFFHGRSGSNQPSHSGGGSGGGEGYRDFGISGHNYSSSHSAFSHRFKSSGFSNRGPHPDSQVSIPLTATKPSSTSSSSASTSNSTTSAAAASTSCSFPPTHSEYPRGPHSLSNKYVSKFRKTSEKVEDTILNTIILGKLNKFSELNYDEIKEFITHIIDSGETDMIKCFMKLVFEKAASEEMFCPLYAKLLGQLSARYPILLTEMANLYSQYMEIFEEINEETATNYNDVCKRNVEKKYRRGYSQFLAELIKHDVIDIDVFMKTVTKIITQVELNTKKKDAMKLNEEYADCLMKIMKAIREEKKLEDQEILIYNDSDDEAENAKIEQIRNLLKGGVVARIAPLTVRDVENVGISNKTRFTLLDIYESIQRF